MHTSNPNITFFVHTPHTKSEEHVRQSPATSAEEEEAAIEHLMETPGLELTRSELESLFDLADETGEGNPQRSSNKDDSAGPKHHSGSLHQERVLTSESSLILFLRRCGLRRSEEHLSTPFL